MEHSQWRYEFWRERRKDGLRRAEHILIHREIEAKSDARSFAFPIKIFLRRVSLLFATFPSRTVEDLKSGDMKKFVALVSVVLVSAIFGKATFEKSAALTTVVTEGESTCGRLLIASNNGYFFSSGVSRDSWFFVPENRLIKIISDPNDATNCESRP